MEQGLTSLIMAQTQRARQIVLRKLTQLLRQQTLLVAVLFTFLLEHIKQTLFIHTTMFLYLGLGKLLLLHQRLAFV